jgi:hypothetical protein
MSISFFTIQKAHLDGQKAQGLRRWRGMALSEDFLGGEQAVQGGRETRIDGHLHDNFQDLSFARLFPGG